MVNQNNIKDNNFQTTNRIRKRSLRLIPNGALSRAVLFLMEDKKTYQQTMEFRLSKIEAHQYKLQAKTQQAKGNKGKSENELAKN